MLLLGPGPFCFNLRSDATARAKVPVYDGPDGVAGFHDIFEDLVDDVFLEDPKVAVAEELFLERFELEAPRARHVADGEMAEVGQACFGAD